MFAWKKFVALFVVAFSCLLLFTIGRGDAKADPASDTQRIPKCSEGIACNLRLPSPLLPWIWRSRTSKTGSVETHPWVWLEAEEFADTNFPHASRSTRGEFCDTCSGDEHLLFLPGQQGGVLSLSKGRPFDPPGY